MILYKDEGQSREDEDATEKTKKKHLHSLFVWDLFAKEDDLRIKF